MRKNVLWLNGFLAFILAVSSVQAEEIADDMWIVEPGSGSKLKGVMQETVNESQAGVKREARMTDTAGLNLIELSTAAAVDEAQAALQHEVESSVEEESVKIDENMSKIKEIAEKAKAKSQDVKENLNSASATLDTVVSQGQPVVIESAMPAVTGSSEQIEGNKIVKSGSVAPEYAPELEGDKNLLKDKQNGRLYMVQSVKTKANRQAEEDERLQPVQLIKVPDEARAKEVWYDELHDMTVRANTPRSFNYPIGDERRQRLEDERDAFDPMARMNEVKDEGLSAHQASIRYYRQKVLNCTRERSQKTSLETDMLEYDGKLYDNAAFLSNTLAETEICLRELGYEIVDVMYKNDPDVMMRYDEQVAKLHVDSTSVDFIPKFCGDNCSLKSVVDAQRTRMAEFQKYLCQLLNESPKDAAVARDILLPEDLNDVPFMGDEPRRKPNFVAKSLRPKRVSAEPQIVRRRVARPQVQGQQTRFVASDRQMNKTVRRQRPVVRQQQRAPEEVPYFEGMEVPMIDESEL